MALTTGFVYKSRRVWDETKFPGRDGVVLSYLVDAANFADVQIDERIVHAGQILTSVLALAKRLGYTEKQMRVSLDHLRKGGELVIETASNRALSGRKNGTLITVVNYRFYTDSHNAEGRIKGEKDGEQRAENGATNNQIKSSETNITHSVIPYHHPSLDEIREFDRLNDLRRDPVAFYDYHAPNWRDGNGQAIYDWQHYYAKWVKPDYRKVVDLSAQIARVFKEV